MMYKDNLHKLIDQYEMSMDSLYGDEHDELFKWRAFKTWRNEWFKPEGAFVSFIDRYNAARKDLSLAIDNSRMHPSSGVIKIWEKEPEAVEHLFNGVLFAQTNNDVYAVQKCMEGFLSEYEVLRQKHFPGNWSYKMDRHSASVFLAMMNPDFNYPYKATEANAMAKYTAFEYSLGSGQDFNLRNYYMLCDEIVTCLQEHESLLRKHFERLTDEFYYDKSLHLLAFDLIYCSFHYNFYEGLIAPPSKRESNKNNRSKGTILEDARRHDEEKNQKIQLLQKQIEEVEVACEEYSDISLIGVQVTTGKYGIGTVVSQEKNNIGVSFANQPKTIKYVLDKKYTARPRFEDDETIIEAFTEYGSKLELIEKLKKEIELL